MSLSLSSLLNPSPDAATAEQNSPSTAVSPRRDSLPPISYVQSPEQTHASQAAATRAGYSCPPVTEQDAMPGLPAPAASPSLPSASPWYGQAAGYDARGSAFDRRPSSGGMQLPMPAPPPAADGRPMSSPTLEHYHVPSRSPEQGRAPADHDVTLAPLRRIPSADQMAQTSPPAHEQPPSLHRPAAPEDGTGWTSKSRHDHRPEPSTSTATPSHSHSHSHPHSMPQSPPPLQKPSPTAADVGFPAPPVVKQEAAPTPPASSPPDVPRISIPQEMEAQTNKAVATLKSEHSVTTQSPLRESSLPVPSTELAAPDVVLPKKRPAPARKKGTATATNRKAPPAKKRKVEPKRSATPSSIASKTPASKLIGSKGTPANPSPAPSTPSQSADPNDEPYDDDDDDDDEEMEDADVDSDDVYCLCRKPDTGSFMIGCDGTCDDWFHGKCVGIEERDKNLIDKYICPNCQEAGIGRTTWKRICRREGCRLPARIGKSRSGKDGSKYCSEDCGVRYFREMVAKTRGRDEAAKSRASRRKSSIVGHEHPSAADDDLGARGGILAAGELKALVTSSKTAEDFKKLGEGVLSPPATPESKKAPSLNDVLTEAEAAVLQKIALEKDAAREKHRLLKDRIKFVTMVRQAASRTAAEKELKPKEYCGYDSRLEWTDSQFETWRQTAAGKQALELDTLAVEPSTTLPENANGDETEFEVCERKKCARHLDWNKLAVDDVRAYMSDNGDRMRDLDREEREVRERAALRAKAGAGSLAGEGRVEVHALPSLGVGLVVDGIVENGVATEKKNDGTEGVASAEETPMVVESVEGEGEVASKAEGDVAMAEAAPGSLSVL